MAIQMVCFTLEDVIFTYGNLTADLVSLLYGEEIYFANTFWNSCLGTDAQDAILSTQSTSIEFLMDDYCLIVQNVISVH
jgi:hypothetical protein